MSLKFDPTNPVPLLASIENTYAQAKLHSAQADLFFGYQIDAIEAELRESGAGAFPKPLENKRSSDQQLDTVSKDRVAPHPLAQNDLGPRSLALSSSNPRAALDSFSEKTIHGSHPARAPIDSREDTDPKSAWVGLSPAILQTPYTELRYLIEVLQLKAQDTVVDLGAAYGRLAMVLGLHYPQINFLGYEILAARAREATRVIEQNGFTRAKVIQANVCDEPFQIPNATVYFTYDLSRPKLIEKLLLKLQKISLKHPITVVGRGLATRHQIETKEFWLSDVISPEHHGNFSIYRTHANSR